MRILSQKKHKARQSPQLHKRNKGAEPMVRCAHCGIYLPRSEALMSNHHTWCSLEHAKLGPRN
nr:PP0621 family protein [Alcaligenes endophyticus]